MDLMTSLANYISRFAFFVTCVCIVYIIIDECDTKMCVAIYYYYRKRNLCFVKF